MNILGITHPISFNSSACVIKDGVLVSIGEEERFIRVKHAPRIFPKKSIQFCLEVAGLKPEHIDMVAVGFSETSLYGGKPLAALIKKEWDKALFGLSKMGIDSYKINFFSHHLSHMMSALACGGHKNWSNVISIDGAGDDCSGFMSNSEGLFSNPKSSVDSSQRTRFPSFIIPYGHSWGLLWEDVTELLGFQRHGGEGKTMGLASYGEPDASLLPSMFSNHYPSMGKFRKFFESKGWKVNPQLTGREYGNPRVDPVSEKGKNLACTLQKYYNEKLIYYAKRLHQDSNCRKFSLVGGCALNCTANGELSKQDFVSELYIQPLSHDGGTAVGAATLAYWEKFGTLPEVKMPHAYWGAEFSSQEIIDELNKQNISFEEKDPAVATAELLADNKVVCFFQGKAEVGPRALGNRSILANPIFKENLDRVNKIKGREYWRPLAPSILEEDYFDVVDAKFLSPFMLMAVPVKEYYREKVPAVVHIDNSCRPQSVSKKTNGIFHKTILEFKKRSGIPIVLNTSYNLSHEPIVNSPRDAIKTFLSSETDALVIGNFVIEK